MVGNVWFPVTGGLFLGDDVSNAVTQLSGHFPDSQDRFAAGADYGSGLHFEYQGTEADALKQYGPQVVSRLNFERGRVLVKTSIIA